MGQEISTYPQRPPNFPIFSITFRSDTVKVVDASPEVVQTVHDIISQYYVDGIQRVYRSAEDRAVDFKLHGFPFVGRSCKEDAVMIKSMCCAMLQQLRNVGWELTLSSDLSRQFDFTTWFFQQVPVVGYKGCHIICLSLSAFDKLQLVNAPAEAEPILLECAGNLLQRHSSGKDYFEAQLYGNLWASFSAEDGFLARDLLLRCFTSFHRIGYRYYGTANLKGTADSVFFISDSGDVGPRDYCFLSLNCNDRIRLINAPAEVISTIKDCLSEHWEKGIQKAEPKAGGAFYEYKLGGYPWMSCGTEAVESRRINTIILHRLITVGWAVVTALDVTRRPNDKAVFLLRRCAEASIPHFAICPTENDKIRIINADKEMLEFVCGVIRNNWTLGVQKEGTFGNSYELKLEGYPWASNQSAMFVLCRMMMARILYELSLRGWKAICSADVSSKFHPSNGHGGTSFPIDVHSWFIAYTGLVSPPATLSTLTSLTSGPPFPPDFLPEAPPSYKEAVEDSQTN